MKRFLPMLSIVALVAGTASAAPPVKFRYKMSKDRPLIYRTQTTMQQTQALTVNGKEMKVESKFVNSEVSNLVVSKIDDKGNIHIKRENKRLKVSMKIGPTVDYTYDSTKDDNETGSEIGAAMTKVYDQLNGSVINFTISPRGEVLDVKGFTELLKDVLKDNPIAQQFTGGGDKKLAKLQFSELLIEFAEKAFSPGETWEKPFELKVPKIGDFKGKTTYKFVGIEKINGRSVARFSESSELSIDIDVEQGGAKVVGSLAVDKSSGTTLFDIELGQVVSKTASYTLSGDLTIDAGGMSIPVKQSQTQSTKMELLKKLPE